MPSLSLGNLKPGVVIEIGPDVRVAYCVDRRGAYLRVDAPADHKITRLAPGTCFNNAAFVCPRCSNPVARGRRQCGACGKDIARGGS